MMDATIPNVKPSVGAAKIHELMLKYGGVIIEGFLTPTEVEQLNSDIDAPFEALQHGSLSDVEALKDFHGDKTKRLTNLVTYSRVFRQDILNKELLHKILEIVYAQDNGSYWMSAAQAIEIHPGNKEQRLHRDQSQFRVFNLLGPDGPEAVINFLTALTSFTEINGATRVIPKSNKWADFTDMGRPENTIPAWMNPGDALMITGKIVHGGGANQTVDEKRRGLALTFSLSYLTPEEAYPFQISRDVAKTMTKKAQRIIGFRSQYPASSGGLWQCDYAELADFLQLESVEEAAQTKSTNGYH
ncbi:Verruculogen synthase [Exophiala xenobiotica]|nr:Verruculogen synthase [Exophiala xenobiotica]KAK5215515.1 Verruculogen synthase [Exophiala xenobiotica]KAK5263300.1 Verruculogen synthase [Exophiala xenobiotica]KAK5284841.1 Verruculogen synthase [Exophiala xenobiotica]KAK5332575.1 Verruculogen synthase [Exophiala xenobiotica]